MKKSNLLFKSLVLASIFSLFIITSCKKDNNETDYQAAEDYSEADIASNDVQNVADYAINNNLTKKNIESDSLKCAEITQVDHGSYITVIVDFGANYTYCFNGKARKGKIIISLTKNKKFYETGFSDTITFDNFYLNYRKIEGKHISTNLGNDTWAISAQNMKVTRPDGKFHTWNSERQRKKIKISSTPIETFYYEITGTANGVNIKGTAYSISIRNPLMIAPGCWWIEKGSLLIKIQGLPDITVDYGDGTCDNKATATVNGKTYDINI